MEKPSWIKQKTYDPEFKTVDGKFDEYKDFKLGPLGYFLIRVNREEDFIEAAHCKNDHMITKIIRGKIAQEVYITICKLGLVTFLEHAAYLGKELKKTELALQGCRI